MITWTDVWKGPVGGRDVLLQRSDKGDKRVRTTARRDVNPTVSGDDSAVVFGVSGIKGDPITIDPRQGQSLRDALMENGEFTADEADEIVSHDR